MVWKLLVRLGRHGSGPSDRLCFEFLALWFRPPSTTCSIRCMPALRDCASNQFTNTRSTRESRNEDLSRPAITPGLSSPDSTCAARVGRVSRALPCSAAARAGARRVLSHKICDSRALHSLLRIPPGELRPGEDAPLSRALL